MAFMNNKPINVYTVQDLISIITQASLKQRRAYVWRRDADGKLILNERVEIAKVFNQEMIKIQFPERINLKENDEILFALPGGSLVFRSFIVSTNGLTATIGIPSMAKAACRRRSKRVPFKYEDKIDFELKCEQDEITAYLLDLSEHGMCLSMTDEIVRKLEINQKITINRASKGITYKECVVRSIRIFKPATMGRAPLYAVGFEFLEAA